jgi:hypothetical protein
MKRFLKYISFFIIIVIFIFIISPSKTEYIMIDFSNYSQSEMIDIALENNIILKTEYIIDNNIEENSFLSQSIEPGTKYIEEIEVIISFSKKEEETAPDYSLYKVNELGLVPIMMYHGIVDLKNEETKYTGGNVDKDGYSRTTEAFRNDLEMYYQSGFRMIRLIDYINGNIDTELGYSPIVLTFDDGNNNINILGVDENNNLIIDPNCAVGILEEFKDKYPDFNVTATFLLNKYLFGKKLNKEILIWLVDNGYDIGNHTKDHLDFSQISINETKKQVSYMYKLYDEIIPEEYVNVLSLPYGSPYTTTHFNFNYIASGEYEGYKYNNEGMLRVGWEPEVSPYDRMFNPLFIKRVRAYDNDGKNFDIEMVFKSLETKKYISDGDSNTIVVRDETNVVESLKDKVIKY